MRVIADNDVFRTPNPGLVQVKRNGVAVEGVILQMRHLEDRRSGAPAQQESDNKDKSAGTLKHIEQFKRKSTKSV